MSAQNDGGPAFPAIHTEQRFECGNHYPYVYTAGGMTLRDWFAGQALAGQMASCANRDNIASVADMAAWAYTLADAMLAAREAKQ